MTRDQLVRLIANRLRETGLGALEAHQAAEQVVDLLIALRLV